MLKSYRRRKLINRIKDEVSKTAPNYKTIENIICDFEKENLSLLNKQNEHKTVTLKKINGALKQCINAHGPINKNYIGSASKRIYGSLKSQNINMLYKTHIIKAVCATLIKISLVIGVIKIITIIL